MNCIKYKGKCMYAIRCYYCQCCSYMLVGREGNENYGLSVCFKKIKCFGVSRSVVV